MFNSRAFQDSDKKNNNYVCVVVDGISALSSNAINTKGFGRVSRGLILLCVFVGCISLFGFHSRTEISIFKLNEEETYFIESDSKAIPNYGRKKSFSTKGNDDPISKQDDGETSMYFSLYSIKFIPYNQIF